MCYGAGRVGVVCLFLKFISESLRWRATFLDCLLQAISSSSWHLGPLKALPFSTCSVNQFTWIPTILRNFAITTGQSCLNWSTVLSTCKVKRSPALHLPVCSPPSCLLAVYISRDSVQETDKYTEFTNIARCSASLNFILWQGSWLHSR